MFLKNQMRDAIGYFVEVVNKPLTKAIVILAGRSHVFLKNQMRDAIGYFVEEVNKPLAKTIIMLAGRYPKPTKRNTVHPNTHRLLDIRDEFFKHWKLDGRAPLVKALFRILIVKYEHSPTWRNMLDWVIKEVPGDWKPFNPVRQMKCWRGE